MTICVLLGKFLSNRPDFFSGLQFWDLVKVCRKVAPDAISEGYFVMRVMVGQEGGADGHDVHPSQFLEFAPVGQVWRFMITRGQQTPLERLDGHREGRHGGAEREEDGHCVHPPGC